MIALAVPPQWRPAPHPTARAYAAKALKLGHYPLVDILADLGELLVVDDGADVGLLVERIADPGRRMIPAIFSAQPVCRLPIGTIPTCSTRTSAGAPAVCCAAGGRIPADDEIAAGSIRRPMRRGPDHS